MKIPNYVEKYMWDVRAGGLDIKDHAGFIIERILEYGDIEAFNWILRTYKKDEILEVLKKSRIISPKTGNLFALYFGIPRKELLCIRKPFIRKQDRF